MPRLKGYRFPREVVAYAVWVYHRFALSTADVEDLLAERGVTVSRETVRKWVNRFGRHFADCIKRDCERYLNCDSCWDQGKGVIAFPPTSFRGRPRLASSIRGTCAACC